MSESTSQELLIATFNRGKVIEIESLLSELPLKPRGLSEFAQIELVEETGISFEENAILKAEGYAAQTRMWTLADDSGLEVEALAGAPGILSARYAGEGASDSERNNKLLNELAKTGDHARRARFVCAIALADPSAKTAHLSIGTCEGRIAHEMRGSNGFGYDSVFIPDGYEQTFGELYAEIKERISHRARALRSARTFLVEHFRLESLT
ncbi:MAG TPA: RdgB/HAM1 family non-canonical purine NTP pyrophosphatase [Pyrinomonadaceae bacterium]|nr:RdgB/HAM1 family non-canonical purine NTP pyrophosphatase [Pyrinomonadaceae bacterium]